MAPQQLQLGYDPGDLSARPYARYFRPDMAPLSAHVREALAVGAVAPELIPPVAEAPALAAAAYHPVETGYAIGPDGSARVAVLTPMPGVEPAMWDWWFAWHGSEAARYKLWHPRAHLRAVWADGRSDLTRYVGRTSRVVEYVGSQKLNLTIRFVPPAQLGLDEAGLAARGETAICARGGLDGAPVNTGWLVHQVRPAPGGAEMRSRFWLGGENIRPRGLEKGLGRTLGRLAGRSTPLNGNAAADLLVHCAQEMSHLAAFLPELYAEFGPQNSGAPR